MSHFSLYMCLKYLVFQSERPARTQAQMCTSVYIISCVLVYELAIWSSMKSSWPMWDDKWIPVCSFCIHLFIQAATLMNSC